jgi:hypothetical protein
MITIDPKSLDFWVKQMREAPELIGRAEVLAVNEAARFGRAEASRQIVREVAFKKSYVSKNLVIKSKARGGRPEAEIEGRFRASSLAQFATTGARFGRQSGVRVRVKAGGGAKMMRRAFFTKLRSGNQPIGAAFNIGLAVRLKAGETFENKKQAKLLREDKNGAVYLLYGPSVNQAFYFVREDIAPKVQNRLTNEFLRQMARLIDG